jgi:hypothetical protein
MRIRTKESEVPAGDVVPVTGERFGQTLESASPDLLRTMVREMAQRMMDAEVDWMYAVFATAVPAEVLAPMAQAGPPAWAACLAGLRSAGVGADDSCAGHREVEAARRVGGE